MAERKCVPLPEATRHSIRSASRAAELASSSGSRRPAGPRTRPAGSLRSLVAARRRPPAPATTGAAPSSSARSATMIIMIIELASRALGDGRRRRPVRAPAGMRGDEHEERADNGKRQFVRVLITLLRLVGSFSTSRRLDVDVGAASGSAHCVRRRVPAAQAAQRKTVHVVCFQSVAAGAAGWRLTVAPGRDPFASVSSERARRHTPAGCRRTTTTTSPCGPT
jgi:hypothetical protein